MLLANFSGKQLEAGLDEAGRGCLAGPVVAAAVILPPDFYHPLLTDSKQLKKAEREQLREEICRSALYWAVAEVSPAVIDEINILNASILAMHQALDLLPVEPEYLIVDGNRFKPYRQVPHACIVKGDSKYFSIAAASVLAKTYRDDLMERLGAEHPCYSWEKNAGYPTKVHRAAIAAHGLSPYHRLSFRQLPEHLEIPL
ncbi:MAG: ribonuclease HII [Hymenobacteraceae bacterium]|nr:ribonuclease HII [Hymenobacteraceae bacterium]MDX5395423.1 ribonuclease HII [Hymenobacteraceae bacterium]MDX5443162.1 ribonuclease HII [Hymenobacteraceae bacterium]MDX5511472.1 ribonuclease HII [Hymenobacteraceae bacterium]